MTNTEPNPLYQYQSKSIILASQSPRRKELLGLLNLPFTILVKPDIEEDFHPTMPVNEVASFLAQKKMMAYQQELLNENNLIITADTIVIVDDEILGKPTSYDTAYTMLRRLSGKKHQVVTGVCIASNAKQIVFSDTSDVWFKELSENEINYYIQSGSPYDKAGGYGIQEWIGSIAITKINGSYHNVMGLPIHKLYETLLTF